MLKQLIGLLDRRDRTDAALLVLSMAIAAFLELFSLGAIIPLIGLLAKPDLLETNSSLRAVYESLAMESPKQLLSLLAALLVLLFLLKNAFLAYLLWFQSKFAIQKQLSLSERLYRAYMRSPYIFHLGRNSAHLVRNINSEVDNLINGVLLPALIVLNEGIVCASVLALLLLAQPVTALLMFAILAGLAVVLNATLRPMITSRGKERSKYGGEMNKWVVQGLGGIREAKVYGREEYFVSSHQQAARAYGRTTLTLSFLSGLPRLMIESIAVTSVLVVVLYMLGNEYDMPYILGVLSLFAVAAVRLMPSATRILSSLAAIRFFWPVIDTVSAAIQDIPAQKNARAISGEKVRFFHDIELRNLWYRYPASSNQAIKGISVRLLRGQSTAIVGRSGAGKSTLAAILLGLISPDSGDVLIDGQSDIDTNKLQGIVGFVPQEPFVLDDSIRRNVAFGLDEDAIDDNKVWGALQAAKLGERVLRSEHGLDAQVGERGALLSGGERQRLMIARALYADPEIIVFDEATSALDPSTEEEVLDVLFGATANRTLVIIAHKLPTIRRADTIIQIADGKIVASGTFSTLVKNNMDFKKLIETDLVATQDVRQL